MNEPSASIVQVRALSITGAEGELRWGYHSASILRAWTLNRDEQGQWTLTATVLRSDDFAVSQRPLKFVASNGWRWPVVELQMVDASLHAVLGPKEMTHVSMPLRSA